MKNTAPWITNCTYRSVRGLIGVTLCFRLHEYAIAADIESMYLQVRVYSRDRNALRFLWYDILGSSYIYE